MQHLLGFPLRFAQSESASHFGFSSLRPITSHPTAVLNEFGLGSRSEHSSYLSHLPAKDAASTGEISPPLLWIDQELEVTICCTPYQVTGCCMLCEEKVAVDLLNVVRSPLQWLDGTGIPESVGPLRRKLKKLHSGIRAYLTAWMPPEADSSQLAFLRA